MISSRPNLDQCARKVLIKTIHDLILGVCKRWKHRMYSLEKRSVSFVFINKVNSFWSQIQSPGVSGPDNDRTIFPTSFSGPEILGPHNDWSLSSPRWNFRTREWPNSVVVVWSWSLSGPVTPGFYNSCFHQHLQDHNGASSSIIHYWSFRAWDTPH